MRISPWLATLVAGISLVSAADADPSNTNLFHGSQVFTAAQLVSRVLERNPGFQAQQAASAAAFHNIEPSSALADLVLSYAMAPATFDSSGTTAQRIEIHQSIPWPGTLTARKDTAVHEADMAHQTELALRVKLTRSAKTAFADLYWVQHTLDIHHNRRQVLEQMVEAATAQFVAGRSGRQEVLHAQLELALLDRHLLKLEGALAAVTADINGLLNRTPDLPLPTADGVPGKVNLPNLEILEYLALEENPELRRLDAQIAARTSRVVQAQKAFYPSFGFRAGYNRLWEDADKRPIIGLSINLPIDRRKRRESLNQAQAGVRGVKWARADESIRIRAEIARTRAGIAEALENVELHEARLLPLADEFLRASLADYQSGNGTFLAAVTAEEEKLEVAEALILSRTDVARRCAELEFWVGTDLSGYFRE